MMPINLDGTDELTRVAVAHYWETLEKQGDKQRKGQADRGGRAAVTGGKQMSGFCQLIEHLLINNGLKNGHIHLKSRLQLPGFFRPTKNWDMLVIHEGTLLAAMEFKSHKGPSFGNNVNNRIEEAVGTGHDLAIAYRDGIFGAGRPRPWAGWVMLVEDCAKSRRPVRVAEPHFRVFPEFRQTTYIQRYEMLLQRLLTEKLYDGAALLTATSEGGPRGDFGEPADDLSMRRFLAGLGGHVSAYIAGS